MPLQERRCPTCRATALAADSYCSSCGSALPQHTTTAGEFRPLALSRPGPPADLHPLQIVPDTSRQRRRLVRRSLALLGTMAVACLFALSLWLLSEGDGGIPLFALAAGSGALTVVALGAWANFAVQRARKRARRHDWRMSTS